MKTYLFLFFLNFCVYETLSAITINNQDINTLIKPGQSLVAEVSNTDNICVRIKNGNIEIGSLKIINISDVQDFFNALNNRKNELYQNVSNHIIPLISNRNMTINGAYISGDEKVLLNAQADIEITNAILISNKAIVFIANQLKLDGCFVDTPLLYIESNSPTSLCQIIRFTFNENISLHASVQGHINFESNETIKDLLVVGASKVEIVFAPQAFENNQNVDVQ